MYSQSVSVSHLPESLPTLSTTACNIQTTVQRLSWTNYGSVQPLYSDGPLNDQLLKKTAFENNKTHCSFIVLGSSRADEIFCRFCQAARCIINALFANISLAFIKCAVMQEYNLYHLMPHKTNTGCEVELMPLMIISWVSLNSAPPVIPGLLLHPCRRTLSPSLPLP